MATPADRRRRQLHPSDPNYGPSAEWGWHGGFPRGLRISGFVSVIVLIALMYPHDQQLGQMHLLWLGGIAAVILVGIVLPARRRY
jgi:hypothetical protein